MKKSRHFLSMPIISLTEGQKIGSVRGLVVNPRKMEVSALLVDQKGFFKEQRVIPYTKVNSVGDNAITVDRSNNAEKVVNLPEIVSLIKDKVSLIGSKVITEKGRVLGVVEEFYVDTETGKVLSLEITGSFLQGLFKGRARLDIDDLVTMGKDVVIASGGAEDRLMAIDTGITETLKSVVDSTSNLWNSSVQRTKDLKINLAKGKNRIELEAPQVAQNEFSDVEPCECQAESPESDPEPQICEDEMVENRPEESAKTQIL